MHAHFSDLDITVLSKTLPEFWKLSLKREKAIRGNLRSFSAIQEGCASLWTTQLTAYYSFVVYHGLFGHLYIRRYDREKPRPFPRHRLRTDTLGQPTMALELSSRFAVLDPLAMTSSSNFGELYDGADDLVSQMLSDIR